MTRRPPTLADINRVLEELREELGELGGELLHRSDEDRRCLRVILKLLRHAHSVDARRGKRHPRTGPGSK